MRGSLVLILLLITEFAYSQPDVPAQGGYWVHDEAKVLSVQARDNLERIVRAERDSTSNQIAVLIVPTLNGGSIEEFSLRVAEAWAAGEREKDNGVLLLISIEERKMRIEVGYGLEGRLTDAMSSRIIRNEIAPRFRNGDYDGGVEAGVKAIIQVIAGEYVNENPEPEKRNPKGVPLSTIIIIIIIIILVMRRRGGGGRGGHWSAGRGWIGPIGGLGGGAWGSSRGGFGGGGFGGSFGGGGGFGGGGASGSW